ncbi:MAG: hypothetical protein JW755_05690 [Candidatus Aminicenantes bacterium]|nr:hypothetical protein [Candidatus Aminicenantes bacterium]
MARKGRVIEVECRCGQLLFQYYKAGRGRLIKCFIERIMQDNVGVSKMTTGTQPVCPSCGKDIGIVKMVRGRPAIKINQGTVKETRT